MLPVLETYGTLVRHMGPLGSGQITKVINNYAMAAHVVVANDVEALVRALGLDVASAAAVLPSGSGASWVLDRLAASMFDPPEHDKGARFGFGLLAKDVQLLRELAGDAAHELFSAEMVSVMLERATGEESADARRVKIAR